MVLGPYLIVRESSLLVAELSALGCWAPPEKRQTCQSLYNHQVSPDLPKLLIEPLVFLAKKITFPLCLREHGTGNR